MTVFVWKAGTAYQQGEKWWKSEPPSWHENTSWIPPYMDPGIKMYPFIENCSQ
jgi:hypothetical protein